MREGRVVPSSNPGVCARLRRFAQSWPQGLCFKCSLQARKPLEANLQKPLFWKHNDTALLSQLASLRHWALYLPVWLWLTRGKVLPVRMTNQCPAWTWSLRPVFLFLHTLLHKRPAPNARSPGCCRLDGGNKAGSERLCRRPGRLQVPALPNVPHWHVDPNPWETFQWTEVPSVKKKQRALRTEMEHLEWSSL